MVQPRKFKRLDALCTKSSNFIIQQLSKLSYASIYALWYNLQLYLSFWVSFIIFNVLFWIWMSVDRQLAGLWLRVGGLHHISTSNHQGTVIWVEETISHSCGRRELIIVKMEEAKFPRSTLRKDGSRENYSSNFISCNKILAIIDM